VAPVRAAEYGLPIFRVASSGISQGVDRFGQVRVSAPFPGPEEMFVFTTPLSARSSLPPDRLLTVLCLGVTVVFILRTLIETVRRKRSNAEA
jgi:apolipoprotein N-acyltransferase